uniref:Uncharacterized protein n=1 Tax=Rhizophora mucronata TaxID=61149 RepID=A0A2P2K8V9_RHIMU
MNLQTERFLCFIDNKVRGLKAASISSTVTEETELKQICYRQVSKVNEHGNFIVGRSKKL